MVQSARRIFVVSGLAATSGSSVLSDAAGALRDQLGIDIGAPHPHLNNSWVMRMVPEPLVRSNSSAAVVKITVDYSSPGMHFPIVPQVRFFATTRGVYTNFARNGNTRELIKVKPPNNGVDFSHELIPDMVGEVQEDMAFGLLACDQLYFSEDVSRWLQYINTINSDSWFGQPPRTWWCRSVVIEPFDQSRKTPRRLRFELEYNPESYTTVVAFRDPITGYVPTSVPQNIDKTKLGSFDGYSTFLTKEERPFGSLPIPQTF